MHTSAATTHISSKDDDEEEDEEVLKFNLTKLFSCRELELMQICISFRSFVRPRIVQIGGQLIGTRQNHPALTKQKERFERLLSLGARFNISRSPVVVAVLGLIKLKA